MPHFMKQDSTTVRRARKSNLTFLIVFASIVLLEMLRGQFLPKWTFNVSSLIILEKTVTIFSVYGLIFCCVLFFKPSKTMTLGLSIILLLLFALTLNLSINPIDTTTQPVDIKIHRQIDNGRKLVIRKYKNAKTNASLQDTVLVYDVGVFRHVYN